MCYSFAGSSSLRVHIRAHSSAKLYDCKICGKLFTQSSSLQQHMNSHTPSDKTKLTKVETVEISDLLTGETVHTVQLEALT